MLNQLFPRKLSGRALVHALLLSLATSVASAQVLVTGVVRDASTDEPIIGANIQEKGTRNGTTSSTDGSFRLMVSNNNAVLNVSYVGYLPQEEEVASTGTMTILLRPDAVGLRQVTVTALGIEREKKALGYAVQDVKGEDLTRARETNVVSALAGRMAGVQVVGNPSGIGSSARITIRGERSLNINNNQPLFVVDGVPISNQFLGSSGRSNQEADYGNGAGFLNPDDIESITVLKGPNAAALYGSRANNGVVVIKTKTGRGSRGIGVSINSTLSFESPLRLPDYQNVYGQGLNGQFEFRDGNGGGLRDGVDESWGPKMEGQLIKQFDGPTANGFRGGDVGNLFSVIAPVDLARQLAIRGDIQPTPFIPRPNNVHDFFELGTTLTNNIAFTGGNDQGNFRLSFTNLNQKGYVPNTDLNRNIIAFSSSYNLSSWLTAVINANYLNSASGNRPNLSYGTENIMYLFNCWLPRSVDVAAMREYWQRGRVGLNQFSFNYNYHDNPYFNLYENTNSQDINRLYGNASLNFRFTPELSLMIRSGTDVNDEFRTRRRAYSTQRFPLGNYREEKIRFSERNTDFLLSWNKPFSERLEVGLSFGGNQMVQRLNLTDVTAPQLAVPGVFSLNNSRVALLSNAFQSERRINSLYASAQLAFNRYLYIDLSGRNDWSSTLPKDNNSYFYYSANTSAVFTEMLGLDPGGILSFGKVRIGYAQVGNDTDPYQLQAVYFSQVPVQGQPAFAETGQIPNAALKPEISKSFEAGVDLRFFRNRVGLDVTYYNTNSENQILGVPLSLTTGYGARLINAGLINNQGVEVMLHLVPFRTAGGFEWNTDVNWSRNLSEVKRLYTDPVSGQEIKNYVMASRYVTVEARVGERMGDMYGIGYARVSNDPKSPYYDPTGQYVGRIVYGTNGKPIATTERIKLGNYNPDWLMGISNSLRYKFLHFSFLFDVRYGGKVYSHTQTVGREGGMIIETLEGRADGYDLSKPGNGVVGNGVVPLYDGGGKITGFKENDVKLSAREWHTTITLGRRLIEGMVYDASFVKLREVQLGVNLPRKWTQKARIQNASLALVGRNLALWTKVPHIDPETASTAGGTVIPGVESVAIPSARSWGLNLNLTF